MFTVRLRSGTPDLGFQSVEAVETDTSTAAGPDFGPEPVPGPAEVSRSRADACLKQLLDNGTVNAKSQCGRCRTMTTGRIFGSDPVSPAATTNQRNSARDMEGPVRRCRKARAGCLESAVSLERRLSDFVSGVGKAGNRAESRWRV